MGAGIPILILAVVVGDHWLGDRFTVTVGAMVLALAFGSLLWYVTVGPQWIGGLFRSPLLTALGKYSYGIYVYHWPLYEVFIQLHLVQRGWPNLIASLTASILMGILSYELVEKHILSLKNSRWLNTVPVVPAGARSDRPSKVPQ